jgi:uncharacterized membrane protein YraQ (UPF0718 family)
VLPAAASIKRQGANNGATAAFLIATPESGVDSIAMTYALMDPVMTAARPLSAFAAAVAAGLTENLVAWPKDRGEFSPDLSCPVDGCCDGVGCDPYVHAHHHTFIQKLAAGQRYAFGELWGDLAGWFWLGLLLAGAVTALMPAQALGNYLGGGIGGMLIMLAVGIPLYICSTASTPIAAAFILKGLSPGAALVFLLAGPATNITSLSVVTGMLGRRAAAIYLAAIALMSVLCGLALDQVYLWLEISPRAAAGQAAEMIPLWGRWAGALILIALSAGPLLRIFRGWLDRLAGRRASGRHHHSSQAASGGGCAGDS